MRWIEVNGGSLRYELIGQGPTTLVLIHEMGGTLESWDFVLPALALSRRVLRYDVRGAGASSKLRGTADLNQLTEDLRALLELVDVSEPAALVGCAVGGAIAVRFAARFGARALIAMPPALGVAPERRAATFDRARVAEEQGMAPGVDALLDAGWPEPLRIDLSRFRSYRATLLANDPLSFAATYRMLAGLDMTADLARITCPTLLLAGRFDRFRPPELVAALASKIKGARFTVLETGHFMALETPEPVAAQINGFLAEYGA